MYLSTPTPGTYPKNPYPRYLFHIENPYPRYLSQESLPQVLVPRILTPGTYSKNPYPKYLSQEPLSQVLIPYKTLFLKAPIPIPCYRNS